MLALAEVLDRDGRVRRSLPVSSWPLRPLVVNVLRVVLAKLIGATFR